MAGELTPEAQALIEALVARYTSDRSMFVRLTAGLTVLTEGTVLSPLLHSVKARVKDSARLQTKLQRKWLSAQNGGPEFDISAGNLYEKINDLAGMRLLHLHTLQFPAIKAALDELFAEYRYRVLEGPTARTWDDEYRRYFESIGVATVPSERMYTSVHYVVEPNQRSKLTAEIQVRTLAEEIWGEVDHSLNYPAPSAVFSCQEQIKVLARVTSSCTRLVDSIFRTQSGGLQ